MRKAALPVVGGLVVIIVIVVQCQRPPEIRLGFDSIRQKVVPIVKHGEVVKWNVDVDWHSGDPCQVQGYESGGGHTTCTIRQDADMNKPFTYKCMNVNCDPEVIVDDTGGLGGQGVRGAVRPAAATAPAATIPPIVIDMYCKNGTTTIEDSPQYVHVGDPLRWTSDGTALKDWMVT